MLEIAEYEIDGYIYRVVTDYLVFTLVEYPRIVDGVMIKGRVARTPKAKIYKRKVK